VLCDFILRRSILCQSSCVSEKASHRRDLVLISASFVTDSLKRDDDATLKKEGKDWVAKRKEKSRQGADIGVETTVAAPEPARPSSEQRM